MGAHWHWATLGITGSPEFPDAPVSPWVSVGLDSSVSGRCRRRRRRPADADDDDGLRGGGGGWNSPFVWPAQWLDSTVPGGPRRTASKHRMLSRQVLMISFWWGITI